MYYTNKGIDVVVKAHYGSRENPVQFMKRTLIERASLTMLKRDQSPSPIRGRNDILDGVKKKIPDVLQRRLLMIRAQLCLATCFLLSPKPCYIYFYYFLLLQHRITSSLLFHAGFILNKKDSTNFLNRKIVVLRYQVKLEM